MRQNLSLLWKDKTAAFAKNIAVAWNYRKEESLHNRTRDKKFKKEPGIYTHGFVNRKTTRLEFTEDQLVVDLYLKGSCQQTP